MRAGAVVLGVVLAFFAAPLAQAQEGKGGVELAETAGTDAGLQAWIAGFRPRALAMGISEATFDQAFRGVAFNAQVIDRDRHQAEFTKTIWAYLDIATSDDRVNAGRKALQAHGPLLQRIEDTYGVDKHILLAVWGLETSYGAVRGNYGLIEALASLAYDGRRRSFFETELLAALKIVQSGDARLEEMICSWAGATGHTQFMPSSYLAHAVDFNGDGRRDIWGDDPADALASTAAYLRHFGWQAGQHWGLEVNLPAGFDYELTGSFVKKPVAEWRALGVRPAAGGDLPEDGAGSVLLPAGARGAAFLVFHNFTAIEAYNPADAYVIGVGHLADRIAGGPPIQAAWPREDRLLTPDERLELQALLARAGFYADAVDGRIGPNTVAGVKAFQRANGLVPDGYASLDILTRLR
nr:lytic murein transglycosylase [Rhodobacter sp. SW2]